MIKRLTLALFLSLGLFSILSQAQYDSQDMSEFARPRTKTVYRCCAKGMTGEAWLSCRESTDRVIAWLNAVEACEGKYGYGNCVSGCTRKLVRVAQ